MFNLVFIFCRCLIDYCKYRISFKKQIKDLKFYGKSYKLLVPDTFYKFKQKWMIRHTVLDMHRMKELAKVATSQPVWPSYNGEGHGPIYDEELAQYMKRKNSHRSLDAK